MTKLSKLLFVFALTLFVPAASPASTANCTFPSALLAVYDNPETTPRQFGDMRRTVTSLMDSCSTGPFDYQSRAVLFQIADREFAHDFTPMLKAARPDQQAAMQEAIVSFEHRLTHYLEQIVRARDVEFKATLLQVGTGKAIAVLGPPVKNDVLGIATNPERKIKGHIRH